MFLDRVSETRLGPGAVRGGGGHSGERGKNVLMHQHHTSLRTKSIIPSLGLLLFPLSYLHASVYVKIKKPDFMDIRNKVLSCTKASLRVNYSNPRALSREQKAL